MGRKFDSLSKLFFFCFVRYSLCLIYKINEKSFPKNKNCRQDSSSEPTAFLGVKFTSGAYEPVAGVPSIDQSTCFDFAVIAMVAVVMYATSSHTIVTYK